MGQYALIIIAAAMLAGGVLVSGLRDDVHTTNDLLSRHQHRTLAADAARTGLNMAVRSLASSATMGSWPVTVNPVTYQTGGFDVSMTSVGSPPGDTVDVLVRGKRTYFASNGQRRDTLAIIEARFARALKDGGIPPAFKKAIATDSLLQVGGNLWVHALAPGENANIHTNSTLKLQGNSFLVEGYGTYTGSLDAQNIKNQAGNFQPDPDFNGSEANVFQTEPLPIPSFNLSNLVPTITVVGDTTLSGAELQGYASFSEWGLSVGRTVGVEDNPFILFVDGNITLDGPQAYTGYGMIVCTGDIIMNPGTTDVIGSLTPDFTTALGLFALNRIVINGMSGNVNITATLYAQEALEFEANGTVIVTGAIISKDSYFKGNGNLEVRYAGPSETIIDPGFKFIVPIGPILIAYSEWVDGEPA